MSNENMEYYREHYDEMMASYRRQADSGSISGAKLYADGLCNGRSGNERNIKAAFPYWKIAADGGDVKSQGIVGSFYEEGTDFVSANPDLAMSYYTKAAYQNYPFAQYRLGAMYFYHKDMWTEGLHWVCCAHVNGLQDATNFINEWIKRNAYNNGNDDTPYYNAAQYVIAEVQRKGIDPSKCDYSRINFESAPKKEGCYIATAVYGSYDASEVMVLRKFRDNVLKRNIFGRIFIRIYYALSPSFARWLKKTTRLNLFVKCRLDKFVHKLKSNSKSYDDL